MEIKFISNDLWRGLERDMITALQVANAEIPSWLVPTLLLTVRLTVNRAVLEALEGTVSAIERDGLLLPVVQGLEEGEEPFVPTMEEMLNAP